MTETERELLSQVANILQNGDAGYRALAELVRALGASKEWIEFNDTWWEFRHHGLAQPGVRIECSNGSEILIGDINTLGGVCDDCLAFDGDNVITKYQLN